VLAVGACGGVTPATERIPVIPAITGASPDVTTTLGPQAAPVLATTTAPAPKPGRGLPVSVDIDSINVHVHSGLIALGLDHGAPSAPPEKTPQVLGYYGLGSPPCQAGVAKVPFVLIGHIDGDHQRGVFYDLKNLKPGDTVKVGLDNGRSCTYRIGKLAEYDKQNLATGKDAAAAKEIWGPVTTGSIRVISCGGKFVGPPLYYASNLVGEGTLNAD
jgi:sortase family protein